jgi:hypothetical protein
MPRTARAAVGGIVYHVINPGNGRMGIFRKPGDYLAFLQPAVCSFHIVEPIRNPPFSSCQHVAR